jgi:hypothetical protein
VRPSKRLPRSILRGKGWYALEIGPNIVIFFVLLNIILSLILLVRPRCEGDRLFGITNLIALLFSVNAPMMGVFLFLE